MQRDHTYRRKSVLTALLLAAVLAPSEPAVAQEGEATERQDTLPNPVIELQREAGDGPGKEVTVLLDESHLKLAVLTLRQGTVLPPHSAPVPTTIQVLQGAGVIHVDGKPIRVAEGELLPLRAGADHDVRPDEGSDMVLLVHYLRGGGSAMHHDDE
jgi:quercetin dioxygenase-like cupin family protein